MNSNPTPDASARFLVSTEAALMSLKAHDGPIIVDFDETLYLRNSTEDFIDAAAPGIIGRLVLTALEVLRPWVFLGGGKTRDAWRVRVASIFPRSAKRWRSRIDELAGSEVNQPVRDAIRMRTGVIIATLGFEPIVKPLLDRMRLGGDHRLVACRMGSLEDRLAGKLKLVRDAVGAETVARAAVLTDSRDDDDILDVCAQPLLVKWPQARFIPAQRGTYLPLEYTHRVKRPGLSYVQRSILGDDYALWLLASIAVSVAPIPHAIGLLLLVLSFWTIYELGYVDNDQIGVKFEASPTLTEEFHRVAVATSVPQAWLWALGLGALGVALVEDSFAPSLSNLAGWMAVLFATFGIYLLYNRVDKSTRIWLYAFLQLARAAAFLVIVPITVFGAMALAAHAVSRWFLYFLYRTTGRDWPLDVSANIVRLMIFGMLVVPLAVAVDIDKASVVTIAIVLGWFSFRSGPRLAELFRRAHLITKVDETVGAASYKKSGVVPEAKRVAAGSGPSLDMGGRLRQRSGGRKPEGAN